MKIKTYLFLDGKKKFLFFICFYLFFIFFFIIFIFFNLFKKKKRNGWGQIGNIDSKHSDNQIVKPQLLDLGEYNRKIKEIYLVLKSMDII